MVSERRDRRIMELGEIFWREMKGVTPRLFDRRYWQGELLEWVMKDESFKVDGFRFVDVFPALRSNRSISSHVRDYLLKEGRELPIVLRTALGMAAGGLMSPLAGRILRANVKAMARRFICQSDVKKAVRVFEALGRKNLTFTADILGEATLSEAESQRYLDNYLLLINSLADAAKEWPDHPVLHRCSGGPLPKANVSVKLSALEPYMEEADLKGTTARLKERLLPLLRTARQRNVFVNFDLEQWATHGITYALFEELSLDPDLIDWPHMGLVLQVYLRSSDQDLARLLALSAKRDTPFTVRLVKGAYWDYEVVHARQNGFNSPVFLSKNKTDACYEALSEKLIKSNDRLHPAFASHNLRSLVHALVVAEEKGLAPADVEVQMLHGMAEPLCRVFS
ncbi:MAG: proline dehydrogenase family protein, partial [Desulfobulbaceae bacterium]|nr:proline dehydrogenase family protein [Desulfobulbaceae bacterium]